MGGQKYGWNYYNFSFITVITRFLRQVKATENLLIGKNIYIAKKNAGVR